MTDCIQERLPFPRGKGRRVEASFSGGDIISNGGVLLLREADQASGLTERVAKALSDHRLRASCHHDSLAIVRQRIYSLAPSYEDLHHHDELHQDLALQTVVGKSQALAAVASATFERRKIKQRTMNEHRRRHRQHKVA